MNTRREGLSILFVIVLAIVQVFMITEETNLSSDLDASISNNQYKIDCKSYFLYDDLCLKINRLKNTK